MKRYWKIILLCFVTIITIGTFYIQVGLASGDKINYTFEKVSGDEKEIDKLIIHGDYLIDSLLQRVKITNKETIHLNHLNFIQDVSSEHFFSPIYKKLKSEHKTFMRGKHTLLNFFYEDEEYLIYVTDNRKNHRIYIQVDVLNKKQGKRTSFEVEEKTYDFISIEEVQMIDNNTIKVLVRGFTNEVRSEELSVYTINIAKEKLEKTEQVLKVDENMSIRVFTNENSISKEKYVVIRSEHGVIYGEEQNSDTKVPEIFVYDFEKNQLKKVELPEIKMAYLDTFAIHHSTLFVDQFTEQGIEAYSYDIVKEKWGEKPVFQVPITLDESTHYFTEIANGKIYVIYSIDNENWLIIGDLYTGDTLYEGKIKAENGKSKSIQAYSIEFDI